jgi:hypothetical protein
VERTLKDIQDLVASSDMHRDKANSEEHKGALNLTLTLTLMEGRRQRVVVCGGGVIGAATTYFLTLKGFSPTVVERCHIACAASGLLPSAFEERSHRNQ